MSVPTLAADVEVGQRLTINPTGCEGRLTGYIIQIPAHRRFAVVEFPITTYDLTGTQVNYSFRECCPLAQAGWRPK